MNCGWEEGNTDSVLSFAVKGRHCVLLAYILLYILSLLNKTLIYQLSLKISDTMLDQTLISRAMLSICIFTSHHASDYMVTLSPLVPPEKFGFRTVSFVMRMHHLFLDAEVWVC